MNTLFMAAMISEAVFALGFIFIPGAMMGQFGVVLNEAAAVFARLFGTALLSFPLLLWYGRRSTRPEFKTAVARVLFLYYLPSTPILLLTQAAGLMNARGWSVIALHLVFLVCFAFYAFKRN